MTLLRDHWGKLLLTLVLLAIAGVVTSRQLRGAAVQAEPARRANVVQTVLVSGRVLPPAELELAARTEGSVLEVLAREGDAVESGAVLARLDATEAEAEVARANAALARTQAASGRSRTIAPRVAQESLSTADITLAEARRTVEQAEALVRSGAWPADRLSTARDAVSRATSLRSAARLELSAARGADRRVADAAVQEALAALALADERLAYTTVRAPVAGVVLERSIEVGDTVRPGRILFRVAADGPPILSVDPDERHLSQLAVDQSAVALSDAFADRPFDARVSFIAPSVDAERGTVEVRLLPTGDIDFLRPNMTVSVEIEVARAENALVIPARLVSGAATATPWVWVADDGRLARREVSVGLRGDEAIQITDGLEERESVIDVVSASLEAGDRVWVEP